MQAHTIVRGNYQHVHDMQRSNNERCDNTARRRYKLAMKCGQGGEDTGHRLKSLRHCFRSLYDAFVPTSHQ